MASDLFCVYGESMEKRSNDCGRVPVARRIAAGCGGVLFGV